MAQFIKLPGSLLLHFGRLRSKLSVSIKKKKGAGGEGGEDILLFINRMETCSILENK